MKNTKTNTKAKRVSIKKEMPESHDLHAKEPQTSRWLEDYMHLLDFKIKPVTERFIERIAQELIEWSAQDSSIVFRDFYDDRYIPESTFSRWANKYEVLKDAVVLAKGRIGSRREKGALGRKYDASLVVNSMSMYDQGWKSNIEWKASLREGATTNAPITINLPDITKKDSNETVG